MREKRITAALLLTVIAAVAVGVSSYLAWKTLTAGPVAGCGAASGPACDEILASRWSKWLGVPVSLLAVGVYAAMIAAAWAAALRPGRATLGLLAFLSLSAFGAGAWFIGVQAIALHGFCPWCLAVHACGLIAAPLMFYMLSNAADQDDNRAATLMSATVPGVRHTTRQKNEPTGLLLGVLGALLGLAALAGGQLATKDESPEMQEVVLAAPEGQGTPELTEQPTANELDGASGQPSGDDEPLPLAPIELRAASNEALEEGNGAGERVFQFTALSKPVNLDEMPVLGSRDAKHVMVEVVDYTCKHCRALHPYVDSALEEHPGELAIVVHHLPLNPGCNPNVPANRKGSPASRYACDYARLAISVWRLAPDKFPAYHNWLMEGEDPPRITKARVRAADLVGDEVLLSSDLRDEAADRITDQCTLLNEIKGGLPVMLFRYSAVQGVPTDPDAFNDLLKSKLGLQ